MKIIFFNCANNGDLHVSRELVKYAMRNVDAQFSYWHLRPPRVLADLPVGPAQQTGEDPIVLLKKDHYEPLVRLGPSTIAFNTWYAASPAWENGYGGCTLNTLHALFKHSLEQLGHNMVKPASDFIPTIDFSCFKIEAAKMFFNQLRAAYRLRVMVCNGPALSGQTMCKPESVLAAVRNLAAAHPDVLFLLTNEVEGLDDVPNILCTRDVIGLPSTVNDLNENAYVGTRCEVIVGMGSGPYTFSYIADNFLDPAKTMICFTHLEQMARWVYPVEAVKCRIISSPAMRPSEIQAVIEAVL